MCLPGLWTKSLNGAQRNQRREKSVTPRSHPSLTELSDATAESHVSTVLLPLVTAFTGASRTNPRSGSSKYTHHQPTQTPSAAPFTYLLSPPQLIHTPRCLTLGPLAHLQVVVSLMSQNPKSQSHATAAQSMWERTSLTPLDALEIPRRRDTSGPMHYASTSRISKRSRCGW